MDGSSYGCDFVSYGVSASLGRVHRINLQQAAAHTGFKLCKNVKAAG